MNEKKLNKAQQEAVEYTNGPLLIVAGAGTGKTTVITEKIAYLIENKLAKPEEILALTFTDKSSEEMRTRIDENLDIGYADMQISTFHTFCEHLLQRHGLDIGISNSFKIVKETGSWLLMHDHLYDFNLDYYRPLGNPTKHIHELLKHFSKCKDELVAPEDYLKYSEELEHDSGDDNLEKKNQLVEISRAYHKYNQLLLDSSALDFGDLIFYSVKLLQKRPNIKKLLQDRYKYILVDEFQDVNWAQYVLVKLLAERGQLTVVGDDDQSIYAFRGASVSNILRFKDDFSNTKEVVLNENYRSGQEILDVAYKTIQNNNPDRLEAKLKVNKKLEAKAGIKSEVTLLHGETVDDEVRLVIEQIMNLKNENAETKWSDFAILARANSHVEPFINALEKSRIPFEFLSSTGLYKQPIVLDCFNFLKVIDYHHESNAVFRLLRLPFFNFSDLDLFLFTSMARRKSVSYYEGLELASIWGLTEEGSLVCTKVKSIIDAGAAEVRNSKPSAVLYSFLETSGYLTYLTHEESIGNRKVIHQIHQLRKFFDFISEFETSALDPHVKHFIQYFTSVIDSGDEGGMAQPDYEEDALNIMSVHRSKGLEFKYVFLINMVEERFPTRTRGDAIEIPLPLIHEKLPEGDIHYQEERRLFYVGATRAKKRLYLTSADNYGGVKKRKPSRFLVEAGVVVEEQKNKKTKKHESNVTMKQFSAIGGSAFGRSNTNVSLAMPEGDQNKDQLSNHIPTSFSFSQIKAYESCPYQYKLAHILRIPTRSNASFSFGQSMHLTMHKFYTKVQEMNSVHQEVLFDGGNITKFVDSKEIKVPSLDDLLKIYDESWSNDWYRNKRQREEYYAKGKQIVKDFYQSHENNWTVPVVLEGGFKIKIGDNVIGGRIDRIDQLPDKSLEIIDYKTGKSKEKLKTEDKDQLLLYQLATQVLPEYSHIGIPSKLTFFYLNDNTEVSFVGKDKELEHLEEKLTKTIEEIKSNDFTATPNKFVCVSCDFKDICEFRML